MIQWVRIRQEGMNLVEFKLDDVSGYQISFDDEFGDYSLFVCLPGGLVELKTGTSDTCHAMLNKLRSLKSDQTIINFC